MTSQHTQTITGAGGPIPGDCWRTAIACLLGVPVLEVPHFIHEHTDDNTWWARTVAFVQAAKPGWTLRLLQPNFPVYLWPVESPLHVIATGPSPRGNWQHSVVASAIDGALVWDPHPDRTGLAGPIDDVAALTELDQDGVPS